VRARWGTIGVAVAVAALCAVLPADAELTSGTACERLAGKDLAPAGDVKLVSRANADGGRDLRGCVLPDGKVRAVASGIESDTTVDRWALGEVRHAIVLVRYSASSQYGGGRSTFVYDLRSGRSYYLAQTCYTNVGSGCRPGAHDTRAASAHVNSAGQAAAAIVVAGTGTIRIVGVASTGRRTRFDSGPKDAIPPRSLRLHGHTVSWTHSGEPRTAELSG
jgi:hypothetical protein